jgi:hypothetical protein
MKINLKGCKPEWYKFPEDAPAEEQIKLEIAPYKQSMANTRMVIDQEATKAEWVLSGKDRLEAFCECFKNHEGLTDDNDKSLKLTREVKEFIFNYEHELKTGIPRFVLEKSGALVLIREDEEKN